ncbi:hypothetical protein EDC19_0746 [Natranaerovirga hydrolytica]|uniref:DhaL domain-containing protein n=1 Tax=Natranaerovirga hydrolytica TaxID=680378 RepID=A0A4R1MYL6_9FIRM|nr:DAK2 domain-containing protein [Natranaerovirga hydrolytica]TCK98326.1 hypothetical protein EDC19_0746 [Natranaerovirga hydrolytica]
MLVNQIDAITLQKLFIAGTKYLESKKDFINELNVFPVPDGDTGTNMSLTILSAAKEVNGLQNPNMASVAKAISSGSLRGARGNSGVILSQLFRGFAKVIGECEVIDTKIMAKAFRNGVDTAYKAVMKPKEGTILTVARAIATKAEELCEDTDDINFVLKETIVYGEEILSQTPDMLPVLKQAGVVDAGGQGLIYILVGAYEVLNGKEINFVIEEDNQKETISLKMESDESIEFGYCTEFIIDLKDELTDAAENDIKAYLSSIGDSIVVVADDDIIKVHVHTNDPGNALQKGLTLGQLSNIKIDNMRIQHSTLVVEEKLLSQDTHDTLEIQNVSKERKETGFIVVSIGEGLSEIFEGLGVDHIIEGGQTMNPSTEDMINAIDKVNADNIFILPNNKNIILAAQQAQNLIEDKNIFVIPTKSIPQGITAIINYEFDKKPEENETKMNASLSSVKTGQLTYAVRDTSIEDKEIKQGDLLGIGDGKILVVGESINESSKALLDELVDDESELISIYYGQDVKQEDVDALEHYIEDKYKDCDIEVHYGGQPLYYYIFSVE